jgi:ribonucleoside-triphosphate reductase
MYPYTKFYLQPTKDRLGGYWANHFSTISVLGMHESSVNFLGKGIDTKEGKTFAEEVSDFVNALLLMYQNESGILFNYEGAPSEGSGFSMCMEDKKRYPDMRCFENNDMLVYTNSTQLPINKEIDIFSALDHQNGLQTKYTGGTVFHCNLGEQITPESAKNLVRTILTDYEIPYISITPTFSICSKHGYISGNTESCPKCGKRCITYSRVIGYYSTINDFNHGRKDEFHKRNLYDNFSLTK